MSSFLVSENCINSIVTYLLKNKDILEFSRYRIPYNLITKGEANRLATDMFRLNCTALEARYGESALNTDTSVDAPFRFTIVERPKVAVAKAMSCFLYQCSEANIPERPLFKGIEAAMFTINHRIVSVMPEYDSAPWGD